jgi:DNA primase
MSVKYLPDTSQGVDFEAARSVSILKVCERYGLKTHKVGQQTPSLSIDDAGGGFHCFGCGVHGNAISFVRMKENLGESELPEAARIVMAIGGVQPSISYEAATRLRIAEENRRAAHEHEQMRRDQKKRTLAANFVKTLQPVTGSPAETQYLRRTRAICGDLSQADLYFSPAAPPSLYFNSPQRKPALIAAMRDLYGEVTAAQITYLSKDCLHKEPFDEDQDARKTFGKVDSRRSRSLVRLGDVRDAAVIGEGIESVLSAAAACATPGFAAFSRDNLGRAELPKAVRRVLIAFDRDRDGGGKAHAEKLATRLWHQGREVFFLPPPEGFNDWNDAAIAGAIPQMREAAHG